MPLVPYSVVVVTWECADYLAALVESMNELLEDDPQLVVVDNASSDDPRGGAERWRGETKFVRLDENVGFGRAANAGVREARYETLVLLNPDTRLVDGSLSALAGMARELGALIGPRMLNADGSIQPSASGSPVGIWPWINAFLPGGLMPDWMKARTEPWRLERRTRVAWLTGACVAAPRSLLLRLGPFDPRIELYAEDMDLGLRATRAGVGSIFAPEVCRVVHHGDASSSRRFPDRGRAMAASNRRVILTDFFGARSERAARLAERAKFEVRVRTKSALGRPNERDVHALEAWRAAGDQRRRKPG